MFSGVRHYHVRMRLDPLRGSMRRLRGFITSYCIRACTHRGRCRPRALVNGKVAKKLALAEAVWRSEQGVQKDAVFSISQLVSTHGSSFLQGFRVPWFGQFLF
jgi:hypothetical protein